MDATRLAALKSEINALATFLTTYDTSVSNYLSNLSPTCLHISDVISTLSNDAAASLALDASWSGHGSAFGALTDFVYEVNAIQRNAEILSYNKATYYVMDDGQKVLDQAFNAGESAKAISYITGSSPDQGITI